MAGAVLVLGPSKWRTDPPTSAIAEDPLSTRIRIAQRLKRYGVDAHLLESTDRSPGETHTRLWFRLIEETDSQTFLIYWPLGARLLGLEKEIGHLTGWLESGVLRGDQVVILTERAQVTDQPGPGLMSVNEPGNRTRWHEDLFAYGSALRVWDNAHSLMLHVIGVALEHAKRRRRDWFPGQ